MSELTKNYGNFINLYVGEGKLNQQDCSFEVGQRPDGQITMRCEFDNSPKPLNAHGIEFSGQTNCGTVLDATGPYHHPQPIPSNFTEEYSIHYGLWNLTVNEPDWSKAHTVTFALTNFLYCGNDANSGGIGTCYNKLKLRLDGSDIVIGRVDKYYDIHNTVVKGETTEVTCELTIDIDGRSRDELRKMVNRICDLLTISQGRRIEWINYKVYDTNSSLVFTHHEGRRTDPRRGFVLIDFRNANTAINYLTRSFPAYKRFDSQHPTLLNGVANIMFDTNAARFAITHALSMFCMVDALGKNLLDKQRANQGKNPKKIYQIKEKIRALKTTYNVCLSVDEIECFAKSRNSVVHELKFVNDTTIKARLDEYERCSHIFHRILLRILDYEHLYNDITLPPGYGHGENMLHSCP